MSPCVVKGRKHWTEGVRLNQKFREALEEHYPRAFTNKQAYKVYADHNAERKTRPYYDPTKPEPPMVSYGPIEKDEWLQMNVRNQLCKMEHLGLLIRVAPGTYLWRLAFPHPSQKKSEE